MNNQEFGKLLKEWKQKNLQEELEEGVLDKLKAGVLGATMATGLAASSPAMASPTEKPSATQQVKELSKNDLGALGYLELYTRSKKADTAMEVYKAMEAIKNQKEVKNPTVVKIIQLAKEKSSKAEAEDPKLFQQFMRYGKGISKMDVVDVDSTRKK